MQEHDELCIHGDADVIGELGHHTALHFGLTAGICNTAQSQRGFRTHFQTIQAARGC